MGWPQNIIYGVHFKVYYNPDKKAHPTGLISSINSGDILGESVKLNVEVSENGSPIKTVQYIGKYADIDYDSDGIYREWQYNYLSGSLTNHLGSSSSAPYIINWNTTWIPDQLFTFEIAARIVDSSDMVYFTEPVSELMFNRVETSIVIIKPYDISEGFVTRKPDRKETFFIRSNTERIIDAQMVWTSWSPGHAHGIYINEKHVFEKEGPVHKYYFHRVHLNDVTVLNEKENFLRTGQTDPGHHGMVVQWPGIMFLLKTDFSQINKTAPVSPDSVSITVDGNGIKIDWIDRADNEKGFMIERKEEGGFYSVINKISWAERTSSIDTTYIPSKIYIYKVTAFNDYGESSSEEVIMVTPAEIVLINFISQSQYMNDINWIQNAGLYFDSKTRGVRKDYLFGVLKPIFNRPFTSSYIKNSFPFLESNEIGQSIFFKPKNINSLGVEAIKFGLNSIAGDMLSLTESDSSFIAISMNVSSSKKAYRLFCYNKTNSGEIEKVDSSHSSIILNSLHWYKFNILWNKLENDTIFYKATVDEYSESGLNLNRKNLITISGIFTNPMLINEDSIYSSIAADFHGGIESLDDFLIYKIGGDTVSTTDVKNLNLLAEFTISQNYPNPFNPSTTILFSLPSSGIVNIEVVNLLGQRIATLINEQLNAGTFNIQWDASNNSSGIYFYSFNIDGRIIATKKMILIK